MNKFERTGVIQYECKASQMIQIMPGMVGKTSGSLIGCFVPILCYDSDLLLGHFGPRDLVDLDTQFLTHTHSSKPHTIYLYRCELTSHSLWVNKSDSYLQLYGRFTEALLNHLNVDASAIQHTTYPHGSDLFIDWTQNSPPKLYTLPTT